MFKLLECIGGDFPCLVDTLIGSVIIHDYIFPTFKCQLRSVWRPFSLNRESVNPAKTLQKITPKPCFLMYSLCSYTYTHADPVHILISVIHNIIKCSVLYVTSVLIATWSDSTVYVSAVWS